MREDDEMSIELTPEMRDHLIAEFKEVERLKGLSNLELIHECLKTEAADYLEVQAMMTRLYSGWENRNVDGTIIDPGYEE